MSRHYVAFSGGLDSTYIVSDLLSKGKEVVIVHVNTGGPSIQLIPEAFGKREMIARFNQLYPNQIVDELSFHIPSITPSCIQGTKIVVDFTDSKGFIDTLPQQLCVRNAMVHVVGTFGEETELYVGWHKDDVESTFSESLYRYLADISSECKIYSREISSEKFIHLPCWEMEKKTMWDSIPNNIRELIIADPIQTLHYKDDGIHLVQTGSKYHEYLELGIELSKEIVLEYKLDKIDYFIIHSTITDIFGNYCSGMFNSDSIILKVLKQLKEEMIFITMPFGAGISPVRTMGMISKKYHLGSCNNEHV